MELFIEAVRQYPCLWNLNHEDYRHGEKKELAWQRIVDSNISGIEDVKTAKLEWKKLRDNHRDSLKRYKFKNPGEAAPMANTWKYAGVMEFLVPFMKTRKGSSITTEDCSVVNTKTSSANNDQSGGTSPLDNVVLGLEKVQQTAAAAPASRKRKSVGDIIEVSPDMGIDPFKQEERENRRIDNKHPIETFFESMAQTMKHMPIYLQNKVKKKVLEIVCEAEEEFES